MLDENNAQPKSDKRWVLIVLLAGVCGIGLCGEAGALRGTMELGPADVTNLPLGRFVEVECEVLSWWSEWDNGWHSFGCVVGPWVLPVLSEDRLGTREDKRSVEGQPISSRHRDLVKRVFRRYAQRADEAAPNPGPPRR